MTIAIDVIDRCTELERIRQPLHDVWRENAKFGLPMGNRFFDLDLRILNKFETTFKSEERGKEIYDATAVSAVERLTSGMESLVTPRGEQWHGIEKDDPFAPEPTNEEEEWFDEYTRFLFAARYDAKSGFALANQLAIRSAIALGTGLYFIDESEKGAGPLESPFKYQSVPLSEAFIAVDHQGNPDTVFRRKQMTARQMVQKWGEDGVSARVKTSFNRPENVDDLYEVIHAVFPRDDSDKSGLSGGVKSADFASVYVEYESRHLLSESGFFEFPYIVYFWHQNPDSAYGEGPVMVALAEIKSLNLLSKNTLRAVQQWTNPPLAVPHDGVTGRINLNAGAVNAGLMTEQGQMLAQPIVTAHNPTFIQQIMELKRDQIRDTLFVNLFQILVQNPQMTATEALIRANEKGELLGPAGSRIQAGLARLLDRETAILQRKGVFEPGSPLEPPESLRGTTFGARFSSEFDRLRRAPELIGIQRTYEFAAQVAAVQPEVLDKLDGDTAIDLAQQINGAPRKVLRTDAEVAVLREQRQQQEQLQNGIALAQAGGEAAQAAIPAVQQGSDLLNQIVEGDVSAEPEGAAQ